MKNVLLILLLLAGFGTTVWAAPNPADPSLRFWLKASDLQLQPGDGVTAWTDASSYHTLMAPRSWMPGETPHYAAMETAPGNMQPAVKFEFAGPASMDSTNRLWQMNNLAPNFDPLNIGDGSDLTAFVVYRPDFTDAGGQQAIFSKRDTNSSVYTMELAMDWGRRANGYAPLGYQTFASPGLFVSERGVTPQAWHVSAMNIKELGPVNDTIDWYDKDTADMSYMLADGSAVLSAGRNATTTGRFGIACNEQSVGWLPPSPGVGGWYRYSGYISEIIIYSRSLDSTEMAGLQDYLNAKYFIPEPATLSLLGLGALALIRRRRG
jgi:hypothetical protein